MLEKNHSVFSPCGPLLLEILSKDQSVCSETVLNVTSRVYRHNALLLLLLVFVSCLVVEVTILSNL